MRSLVVRLLVVLVTSLSMLHLTLVGSGVVCSTDPIESAHGAMAMPGTGSHSGHDASAASVAHARPDAERQQGDHRAPSAERCCTSMSSCGVTTVAGAMDRTSAPAAARGMPAHADAMLTSVGTGPEPPPPKA